MKEAFYTGVMGCYSKGCLDSAVMIRFIDTDDAGHFFYKDWRWNNGTKAIMMTNIKEVIEKVYVPIY